MWNRLSSGSYFPPAVKGVQILKKQGGHRLLGVPTVSDRISQMVVKLVFEPDVEPIFHADSYGIDQGNQHLMRLLLLAQDVGNTTGSWSLILKACLTTLIIHCS